MVVVVVLGTAVQAWFFSDKFVQHGAQAHTLLAIQNQTLCHMEGHSIYPPTSLAQSGPFPPEPDLGVP